MIYNTDISNIYFHISKFIIEDKLRGDQMKYLALCDISYHQHLHLPL